MNSINVITDDTETIAVKLAAMAGEDCEECEPLRQLHWTGEALMYILGEYENDRAIRNCTS